MKQLILLTLLCTCGPALSLLANNVQLSNIQLFSQNNNVGEVNISFDLSWENSWRIAEGPANWDAVWVFGKYRVNGSTWRHLPIAAFDGVPGFSVDPSPEGSFVYRSSPGMGTATANDLVIAFNYRAAGIDDNADLEVRLFAVEMVYVPAGGFTLGLNPDGTNSSFFRNGNSGAGNPPYEFFEVTAEQGAIFMGPLSGNLNYIGNGDGIGILGGNYPKGTSAFYCMKYEVSQQQWVDFFNTLTLIQQSNLDATGSDGKNSDGEVDRNGVSWTFGSDATTTLPNVPMNYIQNEWFYSYLDWSALRPMTELEFEKACRGPLGVQPDEYVWGTNRINDQIYLINAPGAPNEQISNPAANRGNAASGDNLSILRCGIFAASAPSADREETGGTYYGIMEMGGNLYERTIGVGSPEFRAYLGTNGDGTIASNGMATVAGWPTVAAGFSFRGGSAGFNNDLLRIGDRTFGNFTDVINLTYNGIRGVRSN